MTNSRRQFLQVAAAVPALIAPTTAAASSGLVSPPQLRPGSIPVAQLPRHFDVEPGVHNLEAGYWSIMPRVVADD